MAEAPTPPTPPKVTAQDEENSLAAAVPPEYRFVSDKFKHEVLLPNLPVYRKGLDVPESLDLVKKRIDSSHAAFLKRNRISKKHREYLMVLKREFFEMIQDERLKSSFDNFMVPLAEKKTQEYARRNADAIAVAAKKVEAIDKRKRAEEEAKAKEDAAEKTPEEANATVAEEKTEITAQSLLEFVSRAMPKPGGQKATPALPEMKPNVVMVIPEVAVEEGFFASLEGGQADAEA